MSSHEIALWIDERWYDALSNNLKDMTVEDKLTSHLDELIKQLPSAEYERISAEISREEQREKQEREDAKQFTVFHVKEAGDDVYLQVERQLDFLNTARLLRTCLRGESSASSFAGMLHSAEEITSGQFHHLLDIRMANMNKVTGAFELDFDAQTVSNLNITEGWYVYSMQDVSTAVYLAQKKQHLPEQECRERFLDRLAGKELAITSPYIFLSGQRRLTDEDISFSEEIMQDENLLEFYMDVSFDPKEIFGPTADAHDDGGWINLYVDYDMEAGRICDEMDVYQVWADGAEQLFKYQLDPEELSAMLPKMDAYCKKDLGITLDEAKEQYLSEQAPEQTGPMM